ncbi:MAG: glutamate--tRNA ligase [Neomegalonema sp.]|nr:glutamate--tRNA ligase [Neomegalonema sp.]
MAETANAGVVTRFAPSPTGFLHIGGARTALFNWLYARHCGGKFVLRIEDTDRERSTPEATEAIFAGLKWLGVDWDGDAVSQYSRADRHRAAAQQMLEAGAAYRCFSTKAEIEAHREAHPHEPFQSPWRDRDPAEAPENAEFAIRLKAPREGETVIEDAVQGRVAWKNETLDDLIMVRSDGAPTYNLAVVIDDYEMGVTHVIRGDDHLTNAARQTLIYQAMGYQPPVFAHIPLIHGQDGGKLSKRHGALGVEAYRDMGFLPEGLRNYLARLGWGHGDEEVFDDAQAIEWFDLSGVNKAPAKLDLEKLAFINGQHMKRISDDALIAAYLDYRAATGEPAPSAEAQARIRRALGPLRERAKTLSELDSAAAFAYAEDPIEYEEKAQKQLNAEAVVVLTELLPLLMQAEAWTKAELDQILRDFGDAKSLKFGKFAQPLRAALTGKATSPGVFDVMLALGKDECRKRLQRLLKDG